MKNKVNVAVQVLPVSKEVNSYSIVDKAIEVIEKSGVTFRVTPFETVMEGEYTVLMNIVEEVQKVCYNAGADSVMCYVKIQSVKNGEVTILDKMEKYD